MIISLVALVVIGFASVNLLVTISKHQIDVVLSQIEALAVGEEGGESGCPSGGPGSYQCSHTWEINYYDENGQIIRTDIDHCEISCVEGFYACCRRGCICVNDKVEMP